MGQHPSPYPSSWSSTLHRATTSSLPRHLVEMSIIGGASTAVKASEEDKAVRARGLCVQGGEGGHT